MCASSCDVILDVFSESWHPVSNQFVLCLVLSVLVICAVVVFLTKERLWKGQKTQHNFGVKKGRQMVRLIPNVYVTQAKTIRLCSLFMINSRTDFVC